LKSLGKSTAPDAFAKGRKQSRPAALCSAFTEKTWKLTIEYDGTKYSGWQEQRNARTVQGQLRKAAEEFFEGAMDIQGAGRTDAGVHARAQVAHLRVRRGKAEDKRRWPTPDEILRAINSGLPSDVCLLDVVEATAGFHARHDAVARTYIYQISTRRTAFFKKFVWWVKQPLDVAAMSSAARELIGRHNFLAFRAEDKSRPDESPIVVVEDAGIETEGDLIVFRITASHFVWRMVRRVVGALVKLGLGEITAGDFASLLEGKADSKLDVAAWTAPAAGLFLERVIYPEPGGTILEAWSHPPGAAESRSAGRRRTTSGSARSS
jgi:tRNA pseudouridine38-40 synthase